MIRDKLAYAKFHLNTLVEVCRAVFIKSLSSQDKELAASLIKYANELLDEDTLNAYSDIELEMIGISASKFWKPMLNQIA